ncbi:hypothetical protein BLOT_011729 [Blomia tropicalis]|nr:hypothetical protein BLOT_011729 [Blomia tropicalis]
MIKFLSAQLAQKDAEIEKMKKSPPPYFQSTPLADNPYQLDDHSFQSTRTTQTLPADYLTQTNRNEQFRSFKSYCIVICLKLYDNDIYERTVVQCKSYLMRMFQELKYTSFESHWRRTKIINFEACGA